MDTGLDEHQQQALAQLQTLTDGGDEQAVRDILASVDWDVQRAAEIIFDAPSTSTAAAAAASTSTASSTTPPAPSTTKRETFEIDDSEQGQSSNSVARPRRYSHPQPYNPRPLQWRITTLLFYPLHLVSSVLRFVFGLLRIPLPQLNLRFAAFTPRNSNRSLRPPAPNPRVAAERWIRALEEETGGIVMSSSSEAHASASGIELGPSTSTTRSTTMTSAAARDEHDGRKVLPNFIVDSYEGVLRRAQREAKVACIVLVNEEHDNDAEFKRSTLTDPAFVQLLNENDMLVWGGDVRDKDAWSAAQKLQATTYPFVAFAALQPRRTPFTSRPSSSSSSSSPSPTMTVLSRHQGPCAPSGAATSASKLIDHLTAQLLPRVLPFLERIQHQARERERDRELRAEQERAYEDAARRDRARIEALMEQERDSARRREQEKLEQEAREREREQRRHAAEKRMAWRRWTRRVVVGARLENDYHQQAGDGGKPLRIVFRLPGNPRLVRQFSAAETLMDLFAFVDSVLVPSTYAPGEDPVTPPDMDEGVEQGVVDPSVVLLAQVAACPGGADAWWEFKLFNAYPRREIQWDSQTKLGEVDVLRGGAQLVVEPIVARVSSPSRAAADHGDASGNNDNQDDSDGYDTEDSE